MPGLPLQPTVAINSNLDLNLPGLALQPTVGTEINLDPNVPGSSLQPTATVKSNQDPNLNASPVAQNEPKESDNESPTGSGSDTEAAGTSHVIDPEGTSPADPSKDPISVSKAPIQVPQRIHTTIAGHAITAAPTAVAIASTTINPGDSGVTLGGTPVALDKSGQLILGSKTIPLPPGLPKKLTTTLAGLAIAADSAAVAMGSTTLRLGNRILKVDETPLALDTAGQLLIGLKIIPFGTESAKPLVTTIAGQVITAAASATGIAGTTLKPGDTGFPINGTVVSLDTAGSFVVGSTTHTFKSESAGLGGVLVGVTGIGGALTPLMPSVVQSNSPGRPYIGTSTGVQELKGEAQNLNGSLLRMKAVAVIIAMITLIHCLID